MSRRLTTQDITWFLDHARNNQLDLDPPYQRRSVWTLKDRQYFLDTVFRDYPSPPIFLHKAMTADGKSMYHVVDGKQRLETILSFVDNKLKISKNYGDVRLNGKTWNQLEGEPSLRQQFWNYQIPVEMVNLVGGNIVNEVFDRLNRNSWKLTEQELRHSKYDGWFITTAEAESDDEAWKTLGIVTTARAKRMADTQFISELLIVTIRKNVTGFDQEQLDQVYADYDDPAESVGDFSKEQFSADLKATKDYFLEMERAGAVVTRYARTLAHFYTLWSVVTTHLNALAAAPIVAGKYKTFMEGVEQVANARDAALAVGGPVIIQDTPERAYYENSRGASTDLKPRQERQRLLAAALL